MAVAIYFVNSSDEDFTGKWDSVEYTVKSGEKVLLQDYIAIHLAKHLAMREMGKKDKHIPINPSQDDQGNFVNALFREEMKKYLTDNSIEEETEEKLEIAMIQEKTKKKAGRPKKEVEFEDLKK